MHMLILLHEEGTEWSKIRDRIPSHTAQACQNEWDAVEAEKEHQGFYTHTATDPSSDLSSVRRERPHEACWPCKPDDRGQYDMARPRVGGVSTTDIDKPV